MTKRHKTKSSKGRRRRRHARREALLRGAFTSVGIGDHVERGRGKRRQYGRILGWSFDRKGRVTWLVVPR